MRDAFDLGSAVSCVQRTRSAVRFGKSQRLDAQHCAKEMLRWYRYATDSLAEDGPVKQMMQGKKVCCV